MTLFPLVAWDRCDDREANAALARWGHWLGACDRPYGVQSFGLWLAGELVAVAVSASTAGVTCGGWKRRECVELARLCAHPEHRDCNRVALRLWRVTAAEAWSKFWPVRAYVSYANSNRHSGNTYRLDGWTKVAEVRGGTAGGGHQKGQTYEPKSVWVYQLSKQEEAP